MTRAGQVAGYVSWLLLVSLAMVSGEQWTYQEVRATGKFCPERDSCSSVWGARGANQLSWQTRNCFCDENCSLYGDCCIDAETFDQTQQRNSSQNFSCVALKEYGLVYMRTQCSSDWPAGDVKTACENQAGQPGDPVGSLPVTSSRTGLTYSSYYCAVCNNDHVKTTFWQARVECPTLDKYNNITEKSVRNNLQYREEKNQWGVSQGTEFHPCDIAPYLPSHLTSHLRHCPAKQLNQTCPPGYPDSRIAELCHSYTGLVYSDSQGRPFRNIHCALCNQVNTDSLICIKLEILSRARSGIFGKNFHTFSFAILFDINSATGKEVGVESKCFDREIWDPFFSKCRSLVCGNGGQPPVNGKCSQDDVKALPEPVNLRIITTVSTSSTIDTSNTTSSSIASTTLTTILRSRTTSQSSTSKSSLSVNMVKVFDELDALFDSDTTPRSKYPQPMTPSPGLYHPKPSTTSLTSTCPKIMLSSPEYELMNGSVYVPAYRQIYRSGHFWLHGDSDSVYICQPNNTFNGVVKFSPMMGYVTTACLGLSIMCLTFHLVISCIAPQLQTLSGKNLFSLSLALIGAYTTFLANMFIREISAFSCTVLAVTMYYFFLAAFFWMLNIAFEVARTLKQATKDLRLTTGPKWGKYAIYSFVGWIFPAFVVTTAVIIDQVEFKEIPEMFKPGFGGSSIGLCWFSSRKALLNYFVIPFFVIMFINIFFFVSSSFLVWDSTKTSVKITTSGPKISFFLHLRLSVLMGLSWAAGLVAGWLDMEPVWYVFLVLNTLQGLFILVFFTCSKKIVTSVKERVCGRTKRDFSQKKETKGCHDLSRSSLYTSVPGASLTGSGARPFKYSASSYAQYHQYDQRFYS